MLYSDSMEKIVESHLRGNQNWEKKEINIDIGFPMNVSLFYNAEKNAIVIPSPLAVQKSQNPLALGREPVYDCVVKAIKSQLNISPSSISGSLLGQGVGNLHYIAFHQGSDENMTLFDSGLSEPKRFLGSSDIPAWYEKIWPMISATFNPNYFFCLGR